MALSQQSTVETMEAHELAGQMLGHQCAVEGCQRVGFIFVAPGRKLCAPHLIEFADAMAEESREAEYDRHHPYGQGV